MFRASNQFLLLSALLCLLIVNAGAQSTEFSYQGIIKDGAVPANGTYDLEFRLYDAAVDGTQIGSTASRPAVNIVNGLINAVLDFGSGFPGANRFLEIRVRTTGGGGFTILDPRQKVASSPYSIKSLSTDNASQLNGVPGANYLQTNGSGAGLTNLNANNITAGTLGAAQGGTGVGVSGAAGNYLRSTGAAWASSAIQSADIPAGSGNYIQNSGTQQLASAFNISGTGTANIFNAATQYDLGGQHILTMGPPTTVTNLFIGHITGDSNTGANNVFVGRGAGFRNTNASQGTFIGASAGNFNTTGFDNTYVGALAAGFSSTGSSNTFVGMSSGSSNTSGSNNSVLGRDANVGSGALTFATAIGSNAVVNSSNRIQLGRNGSDTVQVGALGTATATDLCVNALVLAACSSSKRYKKDIAKYTAGLELVNKLRPVTFTWTERSEPDLGLIAEEVEEAEPLLATYNERGEIQGVKYKQISVVLINAVKEQQAEIRSQRKLIESQQTTINALLRVVCDVKHDAPVCNKPMNPLP
jgi:hypothetical protein